MYTFKETEVCQFYFLPSACQKRVDSSKMSCYIPHKTASTSDGLIKFLNKWIKQTLDKANCAVFVRSCTDTIIHDVWLSCQWQSLVIFWGKTRDATLKNNYIHATIFVYAIRTLWLGGLYVYFPMTTAIQMLNLLQPVRYIKSNYKYTLSKQWIINITSTIK